VGSRRHSELRHAVRLDPHDAKAFNNGGNVINTSGQYDRAIEDNNETIRLDPTIGQSMLPTFSCAAATRAVARWKRRSALIGIWLDRQIEIPTRTQSPNWIANGGPILRGEQREFNIRGINHSVVPTTAQA
jgi:hypothetical protein